MNTKEFKNFKEDVIKKFNELDNFNQRLAAQLRSSKDEMADQQRAVTETNLRMKFIELSINSGETDVEKIKQQAEELIQWVEKPLTDHQEKYKAIHKEIEESLQTKEQPGESASNVKQLK